VSPVHRLLTITVHDECLGVPDALASSWRSAAHRRQPADDKRVTMEEPLAAIQDLHRRRFLRWGIAAAAAALPMPAWATALGTAKRRLSFVNLHTDETLTALYFANGSYQHNAVKDINYLLRDFRTGDVHPIDLRLLDLLYTLRHRVNSQSPFQVISGYRSPATNARLASLSDGVARRSYHIRGMAIDIALTDLVAALRRRSLATLQYWRLQDGAFRVGHGVARPERRPEVFGMPEVERLSGQVQEAAAEER
jgi:uncharacterized protein YcbK (DUF882 family)